jgi:hypothetical protein
VSPLLLNTTTAFGLAASAGLNSSLTLLLVSLLARFGMLSLPAPYDVLASNVALAVLAALTVLEGVGDKLPGVDTIVHMIQWPLAAATGAILFASQTAAISESAQGFPPAPWPLAATEDRIGFSTTPLAMSWLAPELGLLLGLLTAGVVHGARLAARPLVTGLTLGMGNVAVSLAEDVYALALVSASVFVPAIGLLLLVALLVTVGAVAARAMRASMTLSRWLRGK